MRHALLAALFLIGPIQAQESSRAAAPEDAQTIRLEIIPPDYRFQLQPRFKAPGQRDLVLALGGGAAKGIAHAGVLQRLEEEGLAPDAIAGTSMGAYAGGMYAVGYSGFSIQGLMERMDFGGVLLDRQRRDLGETLWEQESRTSTVFSVDIDRREGLSFEPGASSGLELKRTLQWLLGRGLYYGGASFDQLRVPFRAVSTDLQLGAADAPPSGNLVDAVRASMSLPGMFRPVSLQGHQHVDGILVENLPVHQAKALDPGGLVLAVEVGSQLEAARASSVFGVFLRTLDVTIEERTRFSRQAADVLVRPDTSRAGYLDFHRQVPDLVNLGREAFDAQREALDLGLYGTDGGTPLPGGSVPLERIDAPPRLQPTLRALVASTWPGPGEPVLRRHGYRLLRRILASGLAKAASIDFSSGRPVLKVEAQPELRRLEVESPPEWKDLLDSLLREGGIREGQPFNAAALGRALDRFLLEATLRYRPAVSFDGTAFEEGSGTLRVVAREPLIRDIQVAAGILPKGDAKYLEQLLDPLAGGPIDARSTFERISLAEVRLDLDELIVGGEARSGGVRLDMTPVPRQKLILDAVLAYESTWGFHAGLSANSRNLLGSGASLGFQASTNRFQDMIDLDASRSLHWAPRSGFRIFASHFEQRFEKESLETPADLAPLEGFLAGHTLRERGLGFGYFLRFGRRDQGLLRLDLGRRWSAVLPTVEGARLPAFDMAQLSAEWDSFDRYSFPTEGALVRFRGAAGRLREDGPADRLHSAYLRGRRLLPLRDGLGLDLDAEAGLGWNLPLSRWHSLGGPSFLLGTPNAGFLTPNFALLRLGLPIQLARLFGLRAQLEPRFDAGYLGATAPAGLREGSRVQGLGVLARTEVGRFYLELAVGRTSVAQDGSGFRSRGTHLNLLVGTRPYDLWRRR